MLWVLSDRRLIEAVCASSYLACRVRVRVRVSVGSIISFTMTSFMEGEKKDSSNDSAGMVRTIRVKKN